MVQSGKPERIGRVLNGVLEEAGGSALAALFGLRRSWVDCVGPDMAAHARPVSLERGVLTVAVSHAVFGQELKLRESEIRRELMARTGQWVDRLSFRTEGSREANPEGAAPPPRPARVESAPVAGDADRLRGLRDPELAAALASLRSHLRHEGGG